MATLTIDGKVYDLDLLSEETRCNIRMLQQTDKEIERLELQLAITRTARINYANAVKQGHLPDLPGTPWITVMPSPGAECSR